MIGSIQTEENKATNEKKVDPNSFMNVSKWCDFYGGACISVSQDFSAFHKCTDQFSFSSAPAADEKLEAAADEKLEAAQPFPHQKQSIPIEKTFSVSEMNDILYHLCMEGNICQVNMLITFVRYKYADLDWNIGLLGACHGGHIKLFNLMTFQGANNCGCGVKKICLYQTVFRKDSEKHVLH